MRCGRARALVWNRAFNRIKWEWNVLFGAIQKCYYFLGMINVIAPASPLFHSSDSVFQSHSYAPLIITIYGWDFQLLLLLFSTANIQLQAIPFCSTPATAPFIELKCLPSFSLLFSFQLRSHLIHARVCVCGFSDLQMLVAGMSVRLVHVYYWIDYIQIPPFTCSTNRQ